MSESQSEGGNGNAKAKGKGKRRTKRAALSSSEPSARTARLNSLEERVTADESQQRYFVLALGVIFLMMFVQLFLLLGIGYWASNLAKESHVSPLNDVENVQAQQLVDTDGQPVSVDRTEHIAPLSAVLRMKPAHVHAIEMVQFVLATEPSVLRSLRVAEARVDRSGGGRVLVALVGATGAELQLFRNGTMMFEHDGDVSTAPLLVLDDAERERRKRQLADKKTVFSDIKYVEQGGDILCSSACITPAVTCDGVSNGGCDFVCQELKNQVGETVISCQCDAETDCSGHGECSQTNSHCICDEYWEGENCDQPTPGAVHCSSHGSWERRLVVAYDATGLSDYISLRTFACYCDDGWYGPHCENDLSKVDAEQFCGHLGTVQTSNRCFWSRVPNNASAIQVQCGTDVSCNCFGGYSGQNCDIECNSRGERRGPLGHDVPKCSDVSEGTPCWQCDCEQEWNPVNPTGIRGFCRELLCGSDNDCKNGGKCQQSVSGSSFYKSCVCPFGFIGDLCQDKSSFLNAVRCSGHGYLVNDECRCDFGWAGFYCNQRDESVQIFVDGDLGELEMITEENV